MVWKIIVNDYVGKNSTLKSHSFPLPIHVYFEYKLLILSSNARQKHEESTYLLLHFNST